MWTHGSGRLRSELHGMTCDMLLINFSKFQQFNILLEKHADDEHFVSRNPYYIETSTVTNWPQFHTVIVPDTSVGLRNRWHCPSAQITWVQMRVRGAVDYTQVCFSRLNEVFRVCLIGTQMWLSRMSNPLYNNKV